jgi:adhesin/invasin
VSVSAGAAQVIAGGSPVAIRATVRNINGASVPDGTTVTFTTTAGSFSSSTGLTSTTADVVNGLAEVILYSSNLVGAATVSATAGGVTDVTTVTSTAGAASTVSLTASSSELKADGVSTSTLSAFVADAFGNAISGETVTFTITSGTGELLAKTAITDSNGVAAVSYRASTTTGTSVISATTPNGSTNTVSIDLVAQLVGSLSLTSSNSTITADTTSTSTIRVTVRDTASQPISGRTVDFTTTLGTLSAATAETDINGFASVTLTSVATLGTATVTATVGDFKKTVAVDFEAGVPVGVTILAAPDAVNPSGSSTLNVTVVDGNSLPVSGEEVRFEITTNNSGRRYVKCADCGHQCKRCGKCNVYSRQQRRN